MCSILGLAGKWQTELDYANLGYLSFRWEFSTLAQYQTKNLCTNLADCISRGSSPGFRNISVETRQETRTRKWKRALCSQVEPQWCLGCAGPVQSSSIKDQLKYAEHESVSPVLVYIAPATCQGGQHNQIAYFTLTCLKLVLSLSMHLCEWTQVPVYLSFHAAHVQYIVSFWEPPCQLEMCNHGNLSKHWAKITNSNLKSGTGHASPHRQRFCCGPLQPTLELPLTKINNNNGMIFLYPHRMREGRDKKRQRTFRIFCRCGH